MSWADVGMKILPPKLLSKSFSSFLYCNERRRSRVFSLPRPHFPADWHGLSGCSKGTWVVVCSISVADLERQYTETGYFAGLLSSPEGWFPDCDRNGSPMVRLNAYSVTGPVSAGHMTARGLCLRYAKQWSHHVCWLPWNTPTRRLTASVRLERHCNFFFILLHSCICLLEFSFGLHAHLLLRM